MYSYEDRIRAVELYIKLGKRVRPTIRQLGYPTKNALKGWYREYAQRLDLPAGYAGRPPKYSQAQKEASAGTTRSGSRSLLALSVPSNTERVLDLRHKPVQVNVRTPGCESGRPRPRLRPI